MLLCGDFVKFDVLTSQSVVETMILGYHLFRIPEVFIAFGSFLLIWIITLIM